MQDQFKFIWRRFGRDGQAPCERLEKAISLYADGIASAGEARRVEEHIAACESCKSYLAAIRATSGLLSHQPEPVLPKGLSERLALAIQEERRAEERAGLARRENGRSLSPRWAFAGALAMIALVAAVFAETRLLTPHTLPLSSPSPPRVAALPPSTNLPAHLAAQPAPAEKVASAVPSERAPHSASLSAVIHRQPVRVAPEQDLATVAEATAPRRSVATAWRPAPKRITPERPVMVARNPATTTKSPIPGEAFPVPHPKAPRVTQPVQVAVAPPQGPASHSLTAPPPAVNNSDSGEQPGHEEVAQLPANEAVQPAATSPASIRLASRLKNLDSTSGAAQVAINEERPTDYTGSLSIVGSSIR